MLFRSTEREMARLYFPGEPSSLCGNEEIMATRGGSCRLASALPSHRPPPPPRTQSQRLKAAAVPPGPPPRHRSTTAPISPPCPFTSSLLRSPSLRASVRSGDSPTGVSHSGVCRGEPLRLEPRAQRARLVIHAMALMDVDPHGLRGRCYRDTEIGRAHV